MTLTGYSGKSIYSTITLNALGPNWGWYKRGRQTRTRSASLPPPDAFGYTPIALGQVDARWVAVRDKTELPKEEQPNIVGLRAIDRNAGGTISTEVTGEEATSGVGTVDVFADASTAVTGVSATAGLSSINATTAAEIGLTGLQALGQAGTADVVITGPVAVPVTGVSATTGLGNIAALVAGGVATTGVGASGAVGTTIVSLPSGVEVTGLSVTASVGTTTVRIVSPVYPSGVSAFALTSGVLNWSNVVDG